jgi:putative endonuclease
VSAREEIIGNMRAYVYVLASMKKGTLYTGVTTDLVRRVHEHRTGATRGFTHKYQVRRLVYYEIHEDVREAIRREKQIKKWNRSWKTRLIRRFNPEWTDLYSEIVRQR